jgi:hypothetical protein
MITGQIDTPFNNQDPNTWDIFRVTLSGPTNLNLQLEPGANGGWGLYIGDPQAGQIINKCETANCQIAVNVSTVDVIVIADTPAPYRLSIGAGASGGVAGLAMQSQDAGPTLNLKSLTGAY